MKNHVMYIKVLVDTDIALRLKESYDKKESRYYNFSERDRREYGDLAVGEEYYIVALLHNRDKIINAYLGHGKIILSKPPQKNVKYRIFSELHAGTAVENICKLSELDLSSDFSPEEYISLEESELIAKQLFFIMFGSSEFPAVPKTYKELPEEEYLDSLAQRNQYCLRQYNIRASNDNRSEFQKDYESIIHSKAFRRMVDKAQVFSASKGDYYRTRMTHSQVVAQIARRIAVELKLNLYLTEAIALGHDIGHTPFGHQGERTLDHILQGDGYSIIQNLKQMKKMGFKHNYQSVRVAVELEETYPGIGGLDLSFQTLEGMLKHTKLKKGQYSLSQFVDIPEDSLHFESDFCTTLEGQVVAIADEIAQRGHDMDDAFSSGSLTPEKLEKYLAIKKAEPISDLVHEADNSVKKAEELRCWPIDANSLKHSKIVSDLIDYLTSDVIRSSRDAMDNYDKDAFDRDGHIVMKKVIDFSPDGRRLNEYLETIINNRVINSPEVSLFDSNAATIVAGLFEAYYRNPLLLHEGTRRRLYIALRKVSNNVVDFESGNHNIIRNELMLISQKNFGEKSGESYEEYLEKRIVLIKVICDFIAGMTDSYAIREYERIVK